MQPMLFFRKHPGGSPALYGWKRFVRGFAGPAIAVLALAGCGTPVGRTLSDNVDLDLASEPVIQVDNWVRRSPVQVYVHPDISPATPPKALFLPLRVTQQMEEASAVGANISRLIWQTWLQNKVLGTIEFANTNTPYRPDLALALGAQKRADLVVGGYITHFLDGGTVGDTVVSLSIEAYDVRTGNLMWSMAQGGTMPRSRVSDYLIFATKSRMPTDPAAAVIAALAADMGLKIRNWATDQPPEKPWYKVEPEAF